MTVIVVGLPCRRSILFVDARRCEDRVVVVCLAVVVINILNAEKSIFFLSRK